MSVVRSAYIVAVLLGCMQAAAAADAGQWVQATTFADPEGVWADAALSADGSPSSYASDQANRTGDGPFLECGFADVIHTDRFQVTADFGLGIVDSVEIDALVDGAWSTLYAGSISNAEPTLVTFTAVDTQRVRFRFHYLEAGYYFWLYELRFFVAPATVLPPHATTLSATSVTASTAVLHGRVDDDGGGLCQVRFEYGTDTSYGTATDWADNFASSQTASSVLLDVAGLQDDTTYHFHLLARNASGAVVDGGDQVLRTAPVREGDLEWLAPSGFDASENGWTAKSAALDDDATTSARCYHSLGDAQWSPAIAYSLAPIRTEHVRFIAGRSQYIDAIHVDVHRDGDWVAIYEGDFADRTPQICGFDTGSVDGVRVRFHTSTASVGMYQDLYEIAVRVHPLVLFAETSSRVAQGAGAISLPLVIRPVSSVPVSVAWSLTGGAQLGTDLDATTPVVFAPGQPTAAIPVVVRSSGATVDRTASFQLTSPIAASLGTPSTYALTISAAAAQNLPPVVSAGGDHTTAIDAAFVLHGSASDDGIPGPLTVTWSLVSGPAAVTFDTPNAVDTAAHFTAAGVYVVRLSASDTALTTTSDATITVKPVNQPPTVSAGGAFAVTLPANAVLAGSVTDDGLPNGTLTSQWSTVSGPAVVSFADPSAARTSATFTTAGTYVLRLSATDGALTASADVTVTVVAATGNQAPFVFVGADQTVAFGDVVHLDAIALDDGLPNAVLSTTWSTVSGPASAAFVDPHATMTLASLPVAGVYTLRLTVDDGALTSTADVVITVAATAGRPTIATAASATPNPVTGTTATLKVLGASPLGEGKLTYAWSLVSGPALVSFPWGNNGGNYSKTLAATFTAGGAYVMRCTVTDPTGLTATSDVAITVTPKPTSMAIDPSSTTAAPQASVAFAAIVRDQFGALIPTSVLPVQWSVDALATIGTDGVCTAGAAPGTTTVRAKVVSGTTAVAAAATFVISPATVASRSPLVEPQPFRADAWARDATYASAYVASEDPARALVSAPEAPGVPRLAATNGTYFRPTSAGVATLAVRTAPGAPVAFLCLGTGVFTSASSQKHATVIADASGIATVAFRPGGSSPDAVVASSPAASGSIRFTIEP